MCFTCERERIPWSDSLTNTEDVKAESMVDRLVDQLVRHAVKAHMASQRDRTSTLTLKHTHTKKIIENEAHGYQLQRQALMRIIKTYVNANMLRILSNGLALERFSFLQSYI